MSSPSVSVSPMRSVPWLGMPTTSPAKASSAMARSWAKKNCGAESADRLAGAHELRLHAALEPARADAHEGDAVAMVRVHVGLDLEDEAGHAVLGAPRRGACRLPAPRGGGANSASASMRSRTPKFRSAEPKKTGVRWPSRKALSSNGLQASSASSISSRQPRVRPPAAAPRRPDRRAVDRHRRLVGIEPAHAVAGEIVGAGEAAPAADRPGHRRSVEGERLLDLVEEVERVAALAVHLVDEGDDRDVAQAADLEQLARARLDALRGVDHHHGGIDRRQGPVGVLGEVLVARRVEQVEDAIAVFEGHHRGHDRDAALALDAHPVGAGLDAVALGLDLAGELDRAAEQQQLLGQRGLAGVRVRDDGEGAPARDGVGRGGFSGCGHGLSEMGARRVDSQGGCGCRAKSEPLSRTETSAKGQIRSCFAASSRAGSCIAFHSASLRCRRPESAVERRSASSIHRFPGRMQRRRNATRDPAHTPPRSRAKCLRRGALRER